MKMCLIVWFLVHNQFGQYVLPIDFVDSSISLLFYHLSFTLIPLNPRSSIFLFYDFGVHIEFGVVSHKLLSPHSYLISL